MLSETHVTNSVTTLSFPVGALDRRPLTVLIARVAKFAANALEFVIGERLKTTVLKNTLVLLALIGLAIGLIGTITRTTPLSRRAGHCSPSASLFESLPTQSQTR